MKCKKILSIALALAMLGIHTVGSVSNSVVAEEETFVYGMGSVLGPDESLPCEFEEISTYADLTLPESVDLSTSQYFPQIGDQGQLGACVAFATTYYQFTYEAKKLHEIVII